MKEIQIEFDAENMLQQLSGVCAVSPSSPPCIVVGCSDGLVYRLGFVGHEYDGRPTDQAGEAVKGSSSSSSSSSSQIGDATIERLTELRELEGWKDLFVAGRSDVKRQ